MSNVSDIHLTYKENKALRIISFSYEISTVVIWLWKLITKQ
jgi:hypothetical protein